MLWNKIKTILNPGNQEAPVREQAPAQHLKEVIREKRKTDPLIAPKLGGRALAQSLMSGLKNERGVHIESLLCALGSLAGYSCQASARELLLSQGGQLAENAFVTAIGKDGKKYFFGDAINKPLAEDTHSIWSLAAGIATHLGCQQPVDVKEIFARVAGTVGGPEFGIPRIPEGHQPGDLPANWVKHAWPKAFATIRDYCESPSEWPVAFGIAIQEVLTQAKGAIDPCLALSIIMECAIPMSKVDVKAL